ncbi:phosphoesterase PA-phosphatase [Catellatospora sp. NPDC049609]|uniref:phosphoesterase PA-phosphatase n=1 Tax=Catellatospora sp. NPDC049609 TaxID=3155505 RepID=UPI003420336B
MTHISGDTRPAEQTRTSAADRAAAIVSEVLAPGVFAALLPLTVGALTAGLRGALWGLAAAVFTAVIPLLIIRSGVRRGRLNSHHIDRREDRAVPLGLSILSVAAGLGLLTVLGAPATVRATVAAFGAALALTTLVNLVWKLSAHAATVSAAAVVLTAALGAPGTAAWAMVLVVCWARLRLGAHDLAQVVAGVAAGSAAALAAWTLLT